MRRQALEDEIEHIDPPIDFRLADAEQLLEDFARFWDVEDAPPSAANYFQTMTKIHAIHREIRSNPTGDPRWKERERREFDPPGAPH